MRVCCVVCVCVIFSHSLALEDGVHDSRVPNVREVLEEVPAVERCRLYRGTLRLDHLRGSSAGVTGEVQHDSAIGPVLRG